MSQSSESLGAVSIESQATAIEDVFVGGILFVCDNKSSLSDFLESVMQTFQLMLSIPPKRLLEVVDPLGNMDSQDVPLIDDADLELAVKLLDTLVKLSDDFSVVRIQVICGEAGKLHLVQSPHEGDEGPEVQRNLGSNRLHVSQHVVAIVSN